MSLFYTLTRMTAIKQSGENMEQRELSGAAGEE